MTRTLSAGIKIGTQYTDRKGQVNTVTDIYQTFNSVGELVQVRYVSSHDFLGQVVFNRDVLATTIQRALKV